MYMSSFYWSLPVTGGFYRMPIFRGFGFGYALGIGSYSNGVSLKRGLLWACFWLVLVGGISGRFWWGFGSDYWFFFGGVWIGGVVCFVVVCVMRF
jgi:hypothetical protein